MSRIVVNSTDSFNTGRNSLNTDLTELYEYVDLNNSATSTDTYVDAGGTGVEASDLITNANTATTGATSVLKKPILLKPGIYREHGDANTGLRLKDYVDIKGVSPAQTVVRNFPASSGSEVNTDVFTRLANCEISNLTIIAYRCKYGIHADGAVNNGFKAKNLIVHNRGGQDGHKYDIGIGMHADHRLHFTDVECLGAGIFAHGVAAARVAARPWILNLTNVKANELFITDFSEYVQNTLNLRGSHIIKMVYQLSDTYYLANPSDPLYNQGYLRQSITLNTEGSIIESFEYADANTLSFMGGKMIPIKGMSTICVNKNAGTINKGYAVKLLQAPGMANTDTENTADFNVDLYNGSGIFFGVFMEDTTTTTQGCVQYFGRPQVYALGASSAISYGDPLELNSSGQFLKRTSGVIVAYALESTSSNSLIRAKLA